eukprot:COSAG01_NODE_46_length_32080_cov_716.589319_21_plen_1125_part_00
MLTNAISPAEDKGVAMHDLIDNRTVSLSETVARMASQSNGGRFSLGHLFLTGLIPLVDDLKNLTDLRLLVGSTANDANVDVLAREHCEANTIEEIVESQRYPKRQLVKGMELEAADNVKTVIARMPQTDKAEAAILSLIEMIEKGQLKVRLHTKGPLQARAYIFDFPNAKLESQDSGAGIIGSTNLSLAAVSNHTELNTVVRGSENHSEMVTWFDDLWNGSRRFEQRLLEELKASWAALQVSPYDVYMKSVYTLVQDRLEDTTGSDILWDDDITRKLADFQRVAVEQAIQIINNYGGGFVSDVVGLGKSFIGAAIVKYFERTQRCRPLILCPASLVDMWEQYNETYQLNARVVSTGKLRNDCEDQSNFLIEDEMYLNRDFVLVDESHNFRHPSTQRYQMLEEFLGTGRKCCFLTATPRNKSAWDVYHQLKLFHQPDRTDIPVNPPNLKEFFQGVERGDCQLNDLLANILIRRTRRDIIKWYGFDSETDQRIDPARYQDYKTGLRKAYVRVADRKQYFPGRKLETIEYNIDDAYQGVYQKIRQVFNGVNEAEQESANSPGQLTYARYGLWHYVLPEKKNTDRYVNLQRSGSSLRGLMRVLLFKRFESSVHAFKETIARLLKGHHRFLEALNHGIIPAGNEAQDILNTPGEDFEDASLDALRKASDQYSASDFNLARLTSDIQQDIGLLTQIASWVETISPEKDAKLQTLLEKFSNENFQTGKCLIFTQYADTAKYLHDNLVAATGRTDIEAVYNSDKSRLSTIGRFAPTANPEFRKRTSGDELNVLVATDALSEGLNLQDCNQIINYDLHWNPVRLIQRFGRIDRIGSDFEAVHGFNFLPESGIEEQLGLREILTQRIKEIHETIGEDAAILDPAEQLNEDAMYAIYEQNGEVLDLLDEDFNGKFNLTEAIETFRQLKLEDPEEYQRIADLPDGIRTGVPSTDNAVFVHCKSGNFQQLYLADSDGNVITRDHCEILTQLRCDPDVPSSGVSPHHNQIVVRIKEVFDNEMQKRHAERYHSANVGIGQRYALQGLRNVYDRTEDEDRRTRIHILEKAFREPQTPAVIRDLNRLKKNNLSGEELYESLTDLFNHHGLRSRLKSENRAQTRSPISSLICSGSLSKDHQP